VAARDRLQTSTSASNQVTSGWPASNNAFFASLSAASINAPESTCASTRIQSRSPS
jgi:hypothetical protein